VSEPEADVETAMEQQNAVGQMDTSAGDEENKENLRAKLRNTLSKKQSLPGTFRPHVAGLPLVLDSLAGGVDCFGSHRCRDSTEEEREINGIERVDCNSPFVGFLSPYHDHELFTNCTVCSGRVSPPAIFRPHGCR